MLKRKKAPFNKDRRRKHHHWQATVYYGDGEKFRPMLWRPWLAPFPLSRRRTDSCGFAGPNENAAAPPFATRQKAGPATRLLCRRFRRTLDEGKQVGVDLVSVGRGHTVWKAGIELRRGVLKQLCGKRTGICERHDLIVLPM